MKAVTKFTPVNHKPLGRFTVVKYEKDKALKASVKEVSEEPSADLLKMLKEKGEGFLNKLKEGLK